jgi:NADH-quinone oxidoreductase subunit C
VTDSPSETVEEATDPAGGDPTAALAERVAGIVGSTGWAAEFGTARVMVDPARWVEAIRAARDEAGLRHFSFLSAIDWAKDVAVGEPVDDPDALEERIEVLCRLASVEGADAVTFVAALDRTDPRIDTLSGLFGGALWHEREAYEMFGIDFVGHPQLVKLYLPDAFEGNPLRKSYPLLSREVKPWPGTVDVESMPSADVEAAGDAGASTENVEAGEEEQA